MIINSSRPNALQALSIKSIVVHTVTYFVVGLVASIIFQYGEFLASAEVASTMRSIDDPLVVAGTLFQPIRGLIFALAIFPIRHAIFDRQYGWAILWWLLIAIGILSTFAPATGSIEGLIYTKHSIGYHFSAGLLEVLTQALLFSVILTYWVNHPEKKWLRRSLIVSFIIAMLLPIFGLLALFAGVS